MDRPSKFQDGHRIARADVKRGPGSALRFGRQQIGAHNILDEHKVTRLGSVAEDDGRAILHHGLKEKRDHRGVGGAWVLPRPIDIEIAQAHRLNFEGPGIQAGQVFHGQLRCRIRGKRVIAVVFGGCRGPVAVDSARRGQHDAAHSLAAGGFEDVERAENIRAVAAGGVFQGLRDRDRRPDGR
jgi:hypothetical protein